MHPLSNPTHLLALALLLLQTPQPILAQTSPTSTLTPTPTPQQQQSPPSLPSCALTCLTLSLPHTPCPPTNQTCLCTDAPFTAHYTTCLQTTCSVVDLLSATNSTYAACGIPTRDQSATLTGVIASFGALALIMIIARLVDRGFVAVVGGGRGSLGEVGLGLGRLGWDDAFIAVSGVSSIFLWGGDGRWRYCVV